jgi:hypothetical protein
MFGAHWIPITAHTRFGTCSPNGKDARLEIHKHWLWPATRTRGCRQPYWQQGNPNSQNWPSFKSSFAVIPTFFIGFCSLGTPMQKLASQQSSSPAPVFLEGEKKQRMSYSECFSLSTSRRSAWWFEQNDNNNNTSNKQQRTREHTHLPEHPIKMFSISQDW